MGLIPNFIYKQIKHRPSLLKIIDNIGWLFVDRILRMGTGLLVGVWVARYLGPEQFGLLSFAAAFIGLFGSLATLGLQEIVVRSILQSPAATNETLGTAVLLQLVSGVITYVCILGAIFWLRPDDGLAKLIVAILGTAIVFKFSEVATYWFESQVLSKYIVWVQNGSYLVFAGLKVLLILKGANLTAFAWTTLAEAVVVAFLTLVMFAWRGLKPLKLKISPAKTKELLKDSWPLMLSGIAIMIYMKIDQIMLGQMVGDEAVGIYSAATRISEIWYFIPGIFVASVFPAILEAKEKSEHLYNKRMQYLYSLMVWMSIVVALPMTFLATPIVTLLFGAAYIESGYILAIHIWGSVFVFLGVASNKWFIAENLQLLILWRTVLGAIANVLLNLWLIPICGAVGAALATLMSFAIATFIADLLNKKTRNMFLMKIKALNIVFVLRGIKF